MWTLDTRIDVTPAGRARIRSCRSITSEVFQDAGCWWNFRLYRDEEPVGDLQGGYLTRAEAEDAARDSCKATVREEEEQKAPLPNPRFCPTICPLCKIGNIYGQPTCTDKECPGKY